MQIRSKVFRNRRGFTLVEMMIVVMIISVLAIAAIPVFISGFRRAAFENTVNAAVTFLEQARTQALASELDASYKIPPGGYGIFIDFTLVSPPVDQKVILFIDDWNEAVGQAVNVNYADEAIASRVIPDGKYTAGSDTILKTVEINQLDYIRLETLSGTKLSDGTAWAHAAGNTVTAIFQPPYAETVVIGNGTEDLRSFEAKFELTTENIFRTIRFNRITTTPQIIKS